LKRKLTALPNQLTRQLTPFRLFLADMSSSGKCLVTSRWHWPSKSAKSFVKLTGRRQERSRYFDQERVAPRPGQARWRAHSIPHSYESIFIAVILMLTTYFVRSLRKQIRG
jgi:hypothetical protein